MAGGPCRTAPGIPRVLAPLARAPFVGDERGKLPSWGRFWYLVDMFGLASPLASEMLDCRRFSTGHCPRRQAAGPLDGDLHRPESGSFAHPRAVAAAPQRMGPDVCRIHDRLSGPLQGVCRGTPLRISPCEGEEREFASADLQYASHCGRCGRLAGWCCRGGIDPRRPELVAAVASDGASRLCARFKIGRGASLQVASARGQARVTFAGPRVPVFVSVRFHDLALSPFRLSVRFCPHPSARRCQCC